MTNTNLKEILPSNEKKTGFNKKVSEYGKIISKDFKINKYIYLMAIPGMFFYILFHYVPMYGVIIAFKNFSPAKGIMHSDWIGFKNFIAFFNSYYFLRLIKNTILLNGYEFLWGFPAPILLALLLNEIRSNLFKRVVQTVTYLPHFISVVVICGLIVDFTSQGGLINDIIAFFGGNRVNYLLQAGYFRTIYVGSEIWQGIGWGTIIYLAALSGIDQELYDAAAIDGAGRFSKALNVTLPGIAPTIVILLILRIGKMMGVGADKIILLYNPATYETADVISTFVYRKGILDANYSYSAAVGLFNAVINCTLIVCANKISRKVNETSLW